MMELLRPRELKYLDNEMAIPVGNEVRELREKVKEEERGLDLLRKELGKDRLLASMLK